MFCTLVRTIKGDVFEKKKKKKKKKKGGREGGKNGGRGEREGGDSKKGREWDKKEGEEREVKGSVEKINLHPRWKNTQVRNGHPICVHGGQCLPINQGLLYQTELQDYHGV